MWKQIKTEGIRMLFEVCVLFKEKYKKEYIHAFDIKDAINVLNEKIGKNYEVIEIKTVGLTSVKEE